ncbi:hypothetical protein GCWU000322_00068 [Eubacterium saphenum ATCC 49989]|nr:hypothetical protein GCWU000322_00068 [Eubacterium saphenum ATCC 49989]
MDVDKYANPEFDTSQMYEIRLGLENSVDVDKYADPKFDDLQMFEIRLGLEIELKTKELEMETQRRKK